MSYLVSLNCSPLRIPFRAHHFGCYTIDILPICSSILGLRLSSKVLILVFYSCYYPWMHLFALTIALLPTVYLGLSPFFLNRSRVTWQLCFFSYLPARTFRFSHVFSVASTERRLTLMYLCNEVIQTCGRKKASQFKHLWKNCLKDAMVLCRYKIILDYILFQCIFPHKQFNLWYKFICVN